MKEKATIKERHAGTQRQTGDSKLGIGDRRQHRQTVKFSQDCEIKAFYEWMCPILSSVQMLCEILTTAWLSLHNYILCNIYSFISN